MSRSIGLAMAALVLTMVALAPAVAADPVEPLTRRAQEKSDQLQDDPEGFVGNHTSREGIANETRWTKDSACFAAREAAKEAGGEPPDLDVCPDYEDAREDDEEPDEAVAEPLHPVRGEADRLVDDTAETVDDVVGDPGNAWDALKGYAERTVQAVKRIISHVVDFVRDAVGIGASGTLQMVTGLWQAVTWAADLPRVTGLWMIDGAAACADALVAGGDAVAGFVTSGVTGAVEGLAGLVTDTAGGVEDTVESVGDTAVSWTQSVRDAVGSLLERDPGVVEKDAPAERTKPVTDRSNDLLDGAGDLVPLD